MSTLQPPPLLDELLKASAPAGFEEPATEIWRRAASSAQLGGDRTGSSFARVDEAPPLLAVSGTSTRSVQISRSGVPTGVVSIPLRYMHSPVEMVDLRDVEASVELLVPSPRDSPLIASLVHRTDNCFPF